MGVKPGSQLTSALNKIKLARKLKHKCTHKKKKEKKGEEEKHYLYAMKEVYI